MKIILTLICIVYVQAQNILFYEASRFQFNQSQYSDTINFQPSDSLAIIKYLDFGDTTMGARGSIGALMKDFNFRLLFQKNHINLSFNFYDNVKEPFQFYRKVNLSIDTINFPFLRDSLGRMNLIKFIENNEIKLVAVDAKSRNGKLWVRYKDYYIALFDRDSARILQHTMYGNSLYLGYYKQVNFFNYSFENVHEFWVSLYGVKESMYFLVWFDDNYNAIRIENVRGGMLRISSAVRKQE